MDRAPTLSDLVALAGERYDLLAQAYGAAGPGGFLDEAFLQGPYRALVARSAEAARGLFLDTYEGFEGEPLLSRDWLTFRLDPWVDVVNAGVTYGPDGREVRVSATLGLVLAMDLLAAGMWVHGSEVVPGAYERERDAGAFEERLSAGGHDVLVGLSGAGSMPRLVHARLGAFFERAGGGKGGEQEAKWAADTTLALVWVLAHEVGHHLCGHTGALLQAGGGVGLAERLESAPSPDEAAAEPSVAALLRATAEVMADAYATVRLLWIAVDQVERESWTPPNESYLLDTLCTGATLPSLTFALGWNREAWGDLQGAGLQKLLPWVWAHGYPPPTSRLFGVLAFVFFTLFPLDGTHFDARPNPLTGRLHGLLHRHYGSIDFAGMRLLELFEGARSYLDVLLARGGPSTPEDHLARFYEQAEFVSGLIGGREGLAVRARATSLSPHIVLWTVLAQKLSTELNLGFSQHISAWMGAEAGYYESRGLTAETAPEDGPPDFEMGGLTRDPVYKVIDDWMSNVYDGARMTTEAVAEGSGPVVEAGVRIAKIWRRL